MNKSRNTSFLAPPPTELLPQKIFDVISQMEHENCMYFLKKGGDDGREGMRPEDLNARAVKLARFFVEEYSDEMQFLVSMELGADFVVTILACIYARKAFIPVPLPKTSSEVTRIKGIQSDCGVSVALVSSRSRRYFESEVLSSVFKSVYCVNMPDIDAFYREPFDIEWHYSNLQSNLPGQSEEDLVVIQYTSGSTSEPKGVRISSRNILANHHEVASRWRFNHSDSFLTWLPVFHDMGLFGIVHRMFLSGMQMYMMSPEDFVKKPIRWLKAISAYKIYNSGGPPFAYEMCLGALERENTAELELDLSNWKIAFCGADYVSHELLERFRQAFARYGLERNAVFATYGMAESTIFVMGQRFWSESEYQDKTTSQTLSEGCYFPDDVSANFTVFDEGRHEHAGECEEGEILISGESVTGSYVSQPLDVVMLDDKRWVRTGDLGFIKQGCLYISGRKKDLLKINGRSLYANDIVATLNQYFACLNPHAADVFKKEFSSNSLVLILELNTKLRSFDATFLNELKQDVKTILFKEFGVGTEDIILLNRGTLPKTTSGKVRRNLVETMYREGRLFSG